MQTLSEYIAQKNAETRAWVAEQDGRYASILSENLEHWLSYGVTTPAQLEKYLLVCDVFEMTRSAYGYKPNWSHLMGQTTEELEARIPALRDACEEEIRRSEESEAYYAELEAREEREHQAAVAKAKTRTEWTLENAFAQAGLA